MKPRSPDRHTTAPSRTERGDAMVTEITSEDPVLHDPCHLGVLAPQAVVPALDPDVGHRPGDGRGGGLELLGGAEGVAGPRHEQTRHVEGPEMLGPHPVGLSRRMQGIADEHEARRPASPSATAIEHMRPPIDRPPSAIRRGATRSVGRGPRPRRRRWRSARGPVRGAPARHPVGEVDALHVHPRPPTRPSSMATSAGCSRPALAPGVSDEAGHATPRACGVVSSAPPSASDPCARTCRRRSAGGPGGQLHGGALLLARRVDPAQLHLLSRVVALHQVGERRGALRRSGPRASRSRPRARGRQRPPVCPSRPSRRGRPC